MLYRLWSRFLTWFGDIYLATEPPKVKAEHIRKLLAVARPGDIICRKYLYYLDSYFIKGKYSHSGVIVKSDQMIHSVAEGVSYIDPIDFIKDADGFILLRPRYKSSKLKHLAIEAVKQLIGTAYDFLFDKTNQNAMYCHELTATYLRTAKVEVRSKKVIYADDIIKVCKIILEV